MITKDLKTAVLRCAQSIDNQRIKRPVVNWQSTPLAPWATGMIEAFDVSFKTIVPSTKEGLIDLLNPSEDWVEEHFKERVSGLPLNPGESYLKWPYYKMDKTMRPGEKFSHTYMERFWPKYASPEHMNTMGNPVLTHGNFGIRNLWGDLNDVVNLLAKDPYTRQAYIPIWFPEDTGNSNNVRVPCSLGYLFTIANGLLNITYYMRSCDYYRHLRDDIYLACRLSQWMVEQLNVNNEFSILKPGFITMHIANLHIFEHELKRLQNELKA